MHFSFPIAVLGLPGATVKFFCYAFDLFTRWIFRLEGLVPKWYTLFCSEDVPKIVPEPGGCMSKFHENQFVVYPGHGIAKIESIATETILGMEATIIKLFVLESNMRISVPENKATKNGMRAIINEEEADQVLEILKKRDVKVDTQTWNRRYRDYAEKIKTGSVFEIAEVLRDLFLLKVNKELSYGERRMFETANTLLMKELSLATQKPEDKQQEEVRALFGL